LETSYDTEIHTEVVYGGFWKRFIAFYIDLLIIILAVLVIHMPFSTIDAIGNNGYKIPGFNLSILFYFMMILSCFISLLYYGIIESSPKQATFGKQAMKMIVVDKQYRRISFWRAVVRHSIFIIPYTISSIILLTSTLSPLAHIIGCLIFWTVVFSVLAIIWTKRKQGIHDLIAGCLVIKRDQVQLQSSKH